MVYQPNTIYHIYNQGNNRQRVFFNEGNYDYFKDKMKKYLFPLGDIIAYCLMPNHFHILFKTNDLSCQRSSASKAITKIELERMALEAVSNQGEQSEMAIEVQNLPTRQSNMSHAIGTMLSSYSKGVNAEQGRTGSLFRSKTKAKDGTKEMSISVLGSKQQFFASIENYWFTCFHYIHKNPVEAGLVRKSMDWPHSSAWEYEHRAHSEFVSFGIAENLGLVISE